MADRTTQSVTERIEELGQQRGEEIFRRSSMPVQHRSDFALAGIVLFSLVAAGLYFGFELVRHLKMHRME